MVRRDGRPPRYAYPRLLEVHYRAPWFAFWAKELLRWGTLDPLVASALSLGLAKSRTEAARMQPAFLEWLVEVPGHDSEDQIDPRNLLAWSCTLGDPNRSPCVGLL